MVLSRKSKYALKALGQLARAHGSGPLQIADLAERERIPKKFLEAILLALRNRGVLESRKGKGGGYLLPRHPSQITIGHVLRIIEGSFAPAPCVDGSSVRRCGECRDSSTCGIRLVMRDAHHAVAGVLDSTTLADMIAREDTARDQKKAVLSYDI